MEEDLEVLSYYVKLGLLSDRFSEDTIQTLKGVGYLGCGITVDLEEVLVTTSSGKMYLKSCGIALPEDECIKMPEDSPSREMRSQPRRKLLDSILRKSQRRFAGCSQPWHPSPADMMVDTDSRP